MSLSPKEPANDNPFQSLSALVLREYLKEHADKKRYFHPEILCDIRDFLSPEIRSLTPDAPSTPEELQAAEPIDQPSAFAIFS